MTKCALFLAFLVEGFLGLSQIDTLEIHYFPSNKVSTITILKNKLEGSAKAYNKDGAEIYSANVRNFGGHETVEFNHYESGGVREAKFSSAPDGGIQWYKSKTTFDESGNIIGFQEDSNDQLSIPQIRVHEPIVQEAAVCASIHENKIIVHNHSRHAIEYIVIQRGERKSYLIQSGEQEEVVSYISAQITQDPSQFYQTEVNFQKRRLTKTLKTIVEKNKKGSLLTEYNFHVFESSFNN